MIAQLWVGKWREISPESEHESSAALVSCTSRLKHAGSVSKPQKHVEFFIAFPEKIDVSYMLIDLPRMFIDDAPKYQVLIDVPPEIS